ncbi:hypothetical protein EZS27_042336, partial [termite gut metagenome]
PTFSNSKMMENIIVVAPTTAVPINTGLAVALKVFPADCGINDCGIFHCPDRRT